MAAVDYFLKIAEIPGESTDSKHKNEIDVKEWHWEQTNSGSHAGGGGGGAGKVVMEDIHFHINTDKSSPKLFLACATGQHIKEAILTCRKAGKQQQEFLKIKLNDLLVSKYHTGGTPEDVLPKDHFTLNFTKIEITYAAQKADGTLDSPVVHHYDRKGQSGA